MMKINFFEFVYVWFRLQGLRVPKHQKKMSKWLSFLWNKEGDRQALLMAFRNSGKSTIVGLFCAWVLYTNPSIRILVMAADHALAKKMVRNVKRIIEQHPLTKGLKPPRLEQWASDQFTVCRALELRDPSMLAKGLGANITGLRADLIICDDVEVPKNCDTPLKRQELREKLNELDYILTPNGMQLYIPSVEETEEGRGSGSYGQSSTGDAASGQTKESEEDPSMVNINTAGPEELMTLSGIGEARAQAILSYREENGDFSTIEDIKNVSGIGEGIFDRIKNMITV